MKEVKQHIQCNREKVVSLLLTMGAVDLNVLDYEHSAGCLLSLNISDSDSDSKHVRL